MIKKKVGLKSEIATQQGWKMSTSVEISSGGMASPVEGEDAFGDGMFTPSYVLTCH